MDILRKIITAIRFTGLNNTISSLRYTLRRDWLELRHPPEPVDDVPGEFREMTIPGRALEAQAAENGGTFRFEHCELAVHFLAPEMVRVRWGSGAEPLPYALARTDWPPVAVALEERPEGWLLCGPELQVRVGKDGSLTMCDANGRELRHDRPPQRLRGRRGALAWVLHTHLAPEEQVMGLGEQAGRLNLRGKSYHLWNTDPGGSYGPGTQPLYVPLPVYVSLHKNGSYLAFFENYNPGVMTFGPSSLKKPGDSWPAFLADSGDLQESGEETAPKKITTDLAEARFEGGALQYYVISGPPDRSIQRYTELTGRPALPPRWSLGYHQSRWGYKDEADIREVAAGFREHRMPVSAIHLDIDYMDGYRVFTVDPQRFPDLPGLVQEMLAQGIRLVTIIDPGVKKDPGYFLYQQGLQRGAFCIAPDGKPMVGLVWPGETVFPDFTDPAVRAWWGEQYAFLLDQGIAGIWHDMNEPSAFAAWGDVTLPLPTRHTLEGRGGSHRQGHNVYGMQMNRAGFEALRRLRPEQRPWLVSRSGWAGHQRYAWNWSGDTEATWAGTRMTVPTMLGMGLSGLPFVGPDIGGFNGSPGAELFTRHFQMAALLPFFRTHSAVGTSRREPWVFGEPYTSVLRRYLELRQALMPYLYNLAWETSQTGLPLVRPLFWEAYDDTRLWGVDDAFMLGQALLVAPVFSEGAASREVLLPHGGWYSFWDGTILEGPGAAELPTSFAEMPILVRAGSVLPLQEGDCLVLHVYPPLETGQSGRPLEMYSDAGEGYGPWRLDRLWVERTAGEVVLYWEEDEQPEGERFAFPYSQVQVRLHGLAASQAWVDGQETGQVEGSTSVQPFHHIRFTID